MIVNGWVVLAVYLVGLPVMFKAAGRQAHRDFAEDPWQGDTWAVVLFFTFLWPVTWIPLGIIAGLGRAQSVSPRNRVLRRLSDWTAPKSQRKRLDSPSED